MSSREIIFSAAGVPTGPAVYVDDVFNTNLFNWASSPQTVTNNIDLATYGGLVWSKVRSNATTDNCLNDSGRNSFLNRLVSNTTGAQNVNFSTTTEGVTSVSTTGFNFRSFSAYNAAYTYCAWTFRKQPKFFDVVTYTGNGNNRTIAHNLGSVPGMIIIKRLDTTSDWQVYHRSLGNTQYTVLNTTAAAATSSTRWNNTTPTSSVFSLGTDATVNASGSTYVAYLFAHDAGGFGAAGTDNVISCGSFTTDGSGNATVSLGYEPQWVMFKASSISENWALRDIMRGMPIGIDQQGLRPNTAEAEFSTLYRTNPTSTGMTIAGFAAAQTYIYMAIRRPMKPPTVGTQVFSPVARTGTGANATVSSGFVTDTVIEGNRTLSTAYTKFGAWNRLRGTSYSLTTTTDAEIAAGTTLIQANPWDVMNGYKVGTTSALTNQSGSSFINWMFKRATGFHDVVCYTGTGAARTVAHNLTVVPELMIVKQRSATGNWYVYVAIVGATKHLILNSTSGELADSTIWNDTTPTSSVFSIGTSSAVNGSGSTYVAYLFATLAGISKVGFYFGNGTSQTVNCGFTTGARFVLIKAFTTSNWFVWDTARGIVAGNDPYLTLNTTAAEVTTNDSVDATSSGFVVNQLAATNINVVSSAYIFFAIA